MQIDYENTGNRSVNKYIQPLVVPKPTPAQPLKPGDPRNNAIYLAANSLLTTLSSMKTQILANQAQMVTDAAAARTAADQALADSAAAQAAIVALGIPASQSAVIITPVDQPVIDVPFVASTNGTIMSDANPTPQPQAAIPPIVYALDTPENLYIDINSFTKNSDGTYTANLTFDPIVGAVSKYNYRISATV